MKSKITFLIFIAVFIISCNNDNISYSLENFDVIRVEDDLFTNAPNDNFEIVNASINGNKLNITIEYAGGCGNIYYDLVTGSDYLETIPLQKNIRLAFDDKDNCEASIELELSFDLKQIQVPNTNRVIINLDKWVDQIEYNY